MDCRKYNQYRFNPAHTGKRVGRHKGAAAQCQQDPPAGMAGLVRIFTQLLADLGGGQGKDETALSLPHFHPHTWQYISSRVLGRVMACVQSCCTSCRFVTGLSAGSGMSPMNRWMFSHVSTMRCNGEKR